MKYIRVLTDTIKEHKVFIFPALLVIALFTATALKISGSSIGVYDYLLGDDVKASLIAGQPRTVRSDEWVVNTPFTLMQVKDGFPPINKDVGAGQDMSVVVDVPYKEWSVAFKPQNLAFFIMPVEHALAFKWWFLACLLLLFTYAFILLLYPKKYLLATLVSIIFFLSPFIQWWYQGITILPIAYALLAVVIAYKLIVEKSIGKSVAWATALVYVLVSFALVMYPAFQIVSALVAAAVFVSLLYGRGLLKEFIKKKNLILCGAVLAMTSAIVAYFLVSHRDVIDAIQSTVYPGSRNISSGGFSPFLLMVWPYSYALLDGGPLTVFGNNQSEISGFLLIGFVLLPVLIFRLVRGTSKFTKLEKTLLITTCIGIAIILLRLFVPVGSGLFSLIGLNKVPLVRLVLGLGMLNLIIIVIAAGSKAKRLKSVHDILTRRTIIFASVFFLLSVLGLWLVKHHFQVETIGTKEIVAVAIALATILTALLHPTVEARYAGLVLLLGASLATSGLVNPLYRGVHGLDNDVTRSISSTEQRDHDFWAADDNPMIAALITASGAEEYGGVNTYPQTSVWKKAFPDKDSVYNRYAHVRFSFSPTEQERSMSLIQSDSFRVTIFSCDPLLKELRIRYIVSDATPGKVLPCYNIAKTIVNGPKTITIYTATSF